MRHSSKTLALTIGVMMVCSLVLTAAQAQEAKTIKGAVKSVDVENQALQVVEDVTNQEYTFKLEKTTMITKGDKAITLAEIKAGDKVEVMLEQGKVKSVKVA